MNEKKVNITLKSVLRTEGSPDICELITEGTMRPARLNGKAGWEICYSDSEATGILGSTTTVACFGENYASMHRDGEYETHLIMETATRHHCMYGTDFGSITLGVYAKRIINRMTANGGELYFRYTLDANSSLISENEVYMNVEPIE